MSKLNVGLPVEKTDTIQSSVLHLVLTKKSRSLATVVLNVVATSMSQWALGPQLTQRKTGSQPISRQTTLPKAATPTQTNSVIPPGDVF